MGCKRRRGRNVNLHLGAASLKAWAVGEDGGHRYLYKEAAGLFAKPEYGWYRGK